MNIAPGSAYAVLGAGRAMARPTTPFRTVDAVIFDPRGLLLASHA
jgi:hypothetical protein